MADAGDHGAYAGDESHSPDRSVASFTTLRIVLLSGARVEVVEGAVEGYWCHSGERPTPRVHCRSTVSDGLGQFVFSGYGDDVRECDANYGRAWKAICRATLTRRFHHVERRDRISSRAERYALNVELLLRQVDQDDIGVLARAVEHEVFPVRL